MVDDEREQIKPYIYGLIAAIQFLTILPIRMHIEFEKNILHKSVIFFPVVGALLGIIISLCGWGFSFAAPPSLGALLLVIGWIVLTGGLHLDGLMDSADGLLSRRSKDQMLDIMKDSRVGAFGVISAIVIVALKWSALTYLLQEVVAKQLSLAWLVLIIVGTAMWSRWWMVIAVSSWKPARSNGLASMFHGIKRQYVSTSTTTTLFIYLIVLMIYAINVPNDKNFFWLALLIPMLSAIVGWVAAKWMKAKLDGLTGDTYGAMIELIEAVTLVIAVMFVYLVQ